MLSAGASCDPINKQKRAGKEREYAVKRIAGGMRVSVYGQKYCRSKIAAKRQMIVPGTEAGMWNHPRRLNHIAFMCFLLFPPRSGQKVIIADAEHLGNWMEWLGVRQCVIAASVNVSVAEAKFDNQFESQRGEPTMVRFSKRPPTRIRPHSRANLPVSLNA